jgi:TatD DNase family protein
VSPSDPPQLDCHAHIAPDVTPAQVAGLGGALVFAMTRTPAEARMAARRNDSTLLWGFGAHPAVPAALAAVTEPILAQAVEDFALLGEVGLDRRGPAVPQQRALETVLMAASGRPVLLSLHSTGRTRQLLDTLRQEPHAGAILHWFNGSPEEIIEAAEIGCYFSVNNGMTDERLALIPAGRVLPETDFPASRRAIRAARPADTGALERRIALRDGVSETEVRRSWYANLRRLTDSSGVSDRLPPVWRQTFMEVLDE